jgi:hypothetical protein
MKNFSTSFRTSAINIYRGNQKIESEVMKKFFYYIEAYCAETKSTEEDILFKDEEWDLVFELFTNVMMKKNPFFYESIF